MTLRLVLVGLLSFFIIAQSNTAVNRSPRRLNIPFLGIGHSCRQGCPPHYCDDDPAIIHGYCCGCARFYDNLPVQCSISVECPPNIHGICKDYEYMMSCCCANNP